MASCHLISYGNFSLLCNINANSLIYTGCQLVTVFTGENLGIHNDTILTMRHLQGSISYLSGLLSKNCTKQSLLCRKLSLTLGCNLTYQNIACTNLSSNADDTSVIQILQRIITYTRHITGNFLRT